MKSLFQRLCLVSGLVAALIALVTLAPLTSATLVYAGQDAVPPTLVVASEVADSASLHNPSFDNGDWYEFNARYQHAYPTGSWLPDDDNNLNDNIPKSSRQDWRLWFLDGTSVVDVDPTRTEDPEHSPPKAVKSRPYRWDSIKHQVAGIYQVIYNPTPCLVYKFQMYGQSSPKEGTPYASLKIGIDRVGWHPDSEEDPAVHGDFPDTTAWGDAYDSKFTFSLFTVSAEAWSDDKITVFTYVDAIGDGQHRILWDTGSLQEVTPALISDPDNPPSASGISELAVVTRSTSATLSWHTPNTALGQVYYRLIPTPSEPVTPTGTLLYATYLPLLMASRAPSPWLSTPLNKSPVSAHSEEISDLQPDSTYEYIVASRGLPGEQCVTWASNKQTFTTAAAP